MITLNKLKANYISVSEIPYFELISTMEWFDRRDPIIKRDGNKCTSCGKIPTMGHYDEKSRKIFHLWFGDDKLVYAKDEKGYLRETNLPDVKVAERSYSLHVHHKLYILDRLPWEYLDNELITLCNWCHWEFHKSNIIPVYRNNDGNSLEKLDYTPCNRCNGAGWFPEYKHVQSGICFRCEGARYEQLIKH